MNFRQLIEPSLTYQIAAEYLDYINQKPLLNPEKNAALSQRVGTFVLRRLAAFPLVIMATLDLAFIAVMSMITVLTFNAKGKHHFINLVSTLVLFPQAVGMLALGKQPQVNYVRQVGREEGSIRALFPFKVQFNPALRSAKQKLILAQLKRHDEALLAKALSEINHNGRAFLLLLIYDSIALEPELLQFLIEKAQLATTQTHAQQPYLNQLMRKFTSLDHLGRPLVGDPSFNRKYESLAKKLIDCGAALFTRQASSIMPGFEDLLFGKLTDLDRSVQAGWQSITEILLKIDDSLDIKLSPQEKDARSNKLLCLAAYYQKPSLIKFMLDQGTDPLAQFNGTCAWELALFSQHTKSIQILLETGKINPNSPLPDREMLVPLDFSLFDLSNINPTIDGPRKLPHPTQSYVSYEKRLKTAKMLLHAGATLNVAHLEDERFKQTIAYILADDSEGLNGLKNEESLNQYPAKIVGLTRNISLKAEYFEDLKTFLLLNLPKLKAEKQAITNANTPLIHEAIPEKQIKAGLVEPLAAIISEYYYS